MNMATWEKNVIYYTIQLLVNNLIYYYSVVNFGGGGGGVRYTDTLSDTHYAMLSIMIRFSKNCWYLIY